MTRFKPTALAAPCNPPALDGGRRRAVGAWRLHFCPTHPLAKVARRHCQPHVAHLLGGVACGACWERAIRDDERFATEHGLPREIEPDPDYIDDIAVELACRGKRVELTPVELRAAVLRLSRRGMFPVEIGRRLHITYGAVLAALDDVPTTSLEVAA